MKFHCQTFFSYLYCLIEPKVNNIIKIASTNVHGIIQAGTQLQVKRILRALIQGQVLIRHLRLIVTLAKSPCPLGLAETHPRQPIQTIDRDHGPDRQGGQAQ